MYEETTSVHPVDSSGKSTVDSKYYYFTNGDVIAIQCYNFSKETNSIFNTCFPTFSKFTVTLFPMID